MSNKNSNELRVDSGNSLRPAGSKRVGQFAAVYISKKETTEGTEAKTEDTERNQ